MNYRVIKRKNLQTKQFEWYANAVASGEATLDVIATKIENRCTVTRPDILAVLAAFNDEITDRLAQGQIVRLGELGSLQLGLSSKGATTEKEWDPYLIRKAHVNFRAGKRLKASATGVNYKRVYSSAPPKTETPENV